MRLAFLSRDFLIDVVTNELAQEHFGCQLSRAALALSVEYLPHSPRKGPKSCAIVANEGKYTFCYFPQKEEWKRFADGLSEFGNLTQMINYRDHVL